MSLEKAEQNVMSWDHVKKRLCFKEGEHEWLVNCPVCSQSPTEEGQELTVGFGHTEVIGDSDKAVSVEKGGWGSDWRETPEGSTEERGSSL